MKTDPGDGLRSKMKMQTHQGQSKPCLDAGAHSEWLRSVSWEKVMTSLDLSTLQEITVTIRVYKRLSEGKPQTF